MSSMIKILNQSLAELATITVASSAVRTEKINSDNILNFSIRTKDPASAYINENNIAELDGDYFDIVYYKKEQQSDGKLMVAVECEHVSYRLNDPEYNIEYFTESGTPEYVLGKILYGTGFTVGTVAFSEVVTFSLQQAASRRALLMQFAAFLGGELEFNGFQISILEQRGSSAPKALTVGKDVTVISIAVDKRIKDNNGQPLITYTCGVYKGVSIALGDVISLTYNALNIDANIRVVSKSYDPFNPNRVSIEVGNFVNSLEDDIYRIEVTTVSKDKQYYGAKIGPENGFESIRYDKLARAFFNADAFKMQAGDGSGENWVDCLYFDPVTRKYYFDGTLSANTIEAIKAEIETIISTTIIVQNLYSEYGRIANLTVSELNTGWEKIINYLANCTDDVNYIHAYRQYIKQITASTDGTQTEQLQNGSGSKLYWIDGTHTGMTTNVTVYPVIVYIYTEFVKSELSLISVDGVYRTRFILGAGIGDPEHPERGKFIIEKDPIGGLVTYNKSDGNIVSVRVGENNIEFDPPIIIFPDTTNDSQIIASAETVLPGIDVTYNTRTRVAFDVQMDITVSEAMTVTINARVDGVSHRHTAKYFSGAYKDGLCFNGLLDVVSPGTHTIDITITPSVGTATIDASEYRLMLTIRDGQATESTPWPEIKVTQPYSKINIASSQLISIGEFIDTVVIGFDDRAISPAEQWQGISINDADEITLALMNDLSNITLT